MNRIIIPIILAATFFLGGCATREPMHQGQGQDQGQDQDQGQEEMEIRESSAAPTPKIPAETAGQANPEGAATTTAAGDPNKAAAKPGQKAKAAPKTGTSNTTKVLAAIAVLGAMVATMAGLPPIYLQTLLEVIDIVNPKGMKSNVRTVKTRDQVIEHCKDRWLRRMRSMGRVPPSVERRCRREAAGLRFAQTGI